MVQTTSRFFDEFSKLVVGSAAMAEGFRSEMDAVVQRAVEGVLRTLDVVQREEFEVLQDMVCKLRSTNDSLEARIADLEAGSSHCRK